VNLGCQQQERQQKKYIFAETGERTEVVAGVLHAWSASPVPLILPLPLPRPYFWTGKKILFQTSGDFKKYY